MPLIPYRGRARERTIGALAGKIRLAPDFDETPPEIIDAFEGACCSTPTSCSGCTRAARR